MQKIVTIVAQLIVGIIATFAIYFIGIGNGWELVAFAIVDAIVITIVGVLVQQQMGGTPPPFLKLFIGALIFSAIGAALLLIPIAWGFQGTLLPIVGAIIGYHFAARP